MGGRGRGGEERGARWGMRNVGEMRAGVFLAHVLITRRKWPQAIKSSSQAPPPAICPQNAGTRTLYLSCNISAHMQAAHVLRMIWVLHLENKPTLLPAPVSASLSSPLRLWSVGVCASVSG